MGKNVMQPESLSAADWGWKLRFGANCSPRVTMHWLKCNRTQGNAVSAPTENGSRRCPTSDVLWTQRNGRGTPWSGNLR